MPILLSSEDALVLDELLSEVDTQGLSCDIHVAAHSTLPKIQGLGTLAGAGPHEITFLANPRYRGQLLQTQAAAVLVSPDIEKQLSMQTPLPRFARVVTANPYLLYARLAQWFERFWPVHQTSAGIHATAMVAEDAIIGPGVSIGPHCVVESGARIGSNTLLGPACVIGAGSVLGADSRLHARVTLYAGVTVGDRAIIHSGVVLGADGFGLVPDASLGAGAWKKIPQLGGLRIGDDVEIGANTTIDRGAIEDTFIGDGVKLDNQIMVGHNAHIGAHSVIAGCVGIAGSTKIGERCIIGGAAMLAGHLTIADDVQISGGTSITANISTRGRYTGVYPYASHKDWQRNTAVVQQLWQLRRRILALEKEQEG